MTPSAEGTVSALSYADSVAAMPLERRIGQLLLIAFEGSRVSDDLAAFVERAGIGGVLLFGGNITSPWQGRELTGTLQDAARRAGLPPLFIAIDQEGGSVTRLRHPMTAVPSSMAVAATGSATNARRIAAVLAAELRELGGNLNLSAVVDVNVQPQNPVIGPRAYGDKPELVAAYAAEAIAAHHEHGVLVAAKHFPGHGDSRLDSHRALPALDHDWGRLNSVELPPFEAAIRAGVDAILTAHVVYPKVDPTGRPATLSPFMIEGVLRKRLGFEGLVISDALEMNAIARHYGQVGGAVGTIAAGADIALSVGSLPEQQEIHAALLQAVQERWLPEERINDAVARILAAKARLRMETPSSEAWWPKTEHQRTARQVARESITVVKDIGGLLPLRLRIAERLGVIEFRNTRASPVEEPEVLNLLEVLVRARHGNTACLVVDSDYPASLEVARGFGASCDVVLLATRNAALDAVQASAVRDLLAAGKRAVVLALRSPYDLIGFSEAQCYVASYGDQSCSVEAAAGAIFGDYAPSGSLPIRLV